MEKNYSVYKHTAPNGKVYIGITGQKPEERWGNNGRNYRYNKHFYNAIKKYGWENFEHEIILSGLSRLQACEYEKMYISFFNSNDSIYGYNQTSGGESGYSYSADTLKRLSDASKMLWDKDDYKKKQLQKINSKEYREKQAKAAKTGWESPEVREKHLEALRKLWSDSEYREKQLKILREPERRRKISERSKELWKNQEHREKIRRTTKSLWEGERGKKQRQIVKENNKTRWGDSEYRTQHSGANSKMSKKIFKYDLFGNFIQEYGCVSDAARELNVNSGHISACANGHRKTAYGYIWKYA